MKSLLCTIQASKELQVCKADDCCEGCLTECTSCCYVAKCSVASKACLLKV